MIMKQCDVKKMNTDNVKKMNQCTTNTSQPKNLLPGLERRGYNKY